jgi:hypothetical protein
MLAKSRAAKNLSGTPYMKTKTRIEVRIETHEVIVIRPASRLPVAWCATCSAEVRSFSLAQAAAVASTSAHEIHRRIVDGTLHSTRADAADSAVCSRSLELTDLA